MRKGERFISESGSPKITLLPEYLETLSDGEYELIAYFRGYVAVSTKFEVMSAVDDVSSESGLNLSDAGTYPRTDGKLNGFAAMTSDSKISIRRERKRYRVVG